MGRQPAPYISNVLGEFMHKSKTGSLRANKGKPEFSQLSPDFIIQLAALMTKSAEKYEKFNWARGQEYCTPSDSLFRHFAAFLAGEDKDPESGFAHVLHIAANAMIIYESMKIEGMDDRHKWGKK